MIASLSIIHRPTLQSMISSCYDSDDYFNGTCAAVRPAPFVPENASLDELVAQLRSDQLRLTKLAREDSLTGLQNRSSFIRQLSASLASMTSHAGELAILYLDLDQFKPVNDTLGHPVGDEVLRHVARRIGNVVRSGDVVGRMGGDEFAILQCGQSQPAASRSLGNRIIEVLNEPIVINDQVIHIGASIGVAISPFDGETAEELLKNADLALYQSKQDGRRTLRFFEPQMDARMQARRKLEVQLRTAIEREQFEIHYQPVLDLETDRIVSLEALVRWNHPELGRVPPDQFIPLAEETGLIIPLGAWVLQQACLQAVTWPDGIGVAVNLSPVQLRNRHLITTVTQALEASGLPPNRLELEITETALMCNTELTVGLLHQLRAAGVRIAMDDFGTGYSSISYLLKFPFDKIKIDRSFVSGKPSSGETMALVRMIAALGTSLGVTTTAEGVETDAEMASVRAAGCSEIQGYLLSKPIPSSGIDRLIHQQNDANTLSTRETH